jgi:hypothetical protein
MEKKESAYTWLKRWTDEYERARSGPGLEAMLATMEESARGAIEADQNAEMVKDARMVLAHIRCVRALRAKGAIDHERYELLMLGMSYERMGWRHAQALARVGAAPDGRRVVYGWRGRYFRCSELQKRILKFFDGADEGSWSAFIRSVWEEEPIATSTRYEKAISGLNKLLLDNGIALVVNKRGDRITIDEGSA